MDTENKNHQLQYLGAAESCERQRVGGDGDNNTHVHLIISASQGYTISNIMRDFKKFTSKKITAAIEENPQKSRKEWMLNMFAYAEKITTTMRNTSSGSRRTTGDDVTAVLPQVLQLHHLFQAGHVTAK